MSLSALSSNFLALRDGGGPQSADDDMEGRVDAGGSLGAVSALEQHLQAAHVATPASNAALRGGGGYGPASSSSSAAHGRTQPYPKAKTMADMSKAETLAQLG